MQIPKKVDYAVQFLRYLATKHERGSVVSLRDVSNELNIPFLFLQQIAQTLKKEKFVNATRGAHGGYFLIKDLKETSLFDVMELFDQTKEIVPCVSHTCAKSDTCTVKGIWHKVHYNMQHIFQTTYVLE